MHSLIAAEAQRTGQGIAETTKRLVTEALSKQTDTDGATTKVAPIVLREQAKPEEGNMAECLDCKLNAHIAQEARDRAAALEKANTDLQTSLTAQGEVARKEAADVKAKAAADVEAAQQRDMPSLREVVDHCVNGKCASHEAELREFLTTQQTHWQQNLTPDDAKVIAKQFKLWPPPTIEVSGLSMASHAQR